MVTSNAVFAYETDQYSTSFYDLKDSTEQLDRVVNDAIEHVVNNWNQNQNDYKLGSRIAGFFHSRQFEKWVNDSKSIESRNLKSDSVFKTTGWESSFIIQWKGLSASFSLNNVQIGTDKLSHFFGVGWIYWKKSEVEHEGETEEERRAAAIEEGVFTEETYWGRLSTNVFSNADLVANWEGYLFFRGLLEDNIVNGKKAIIRWEGDQPVIQRRFTFKDHVTDFWSESLLPNDYDSLLGVKVKNVLRTYCDRPLFVKQPQRWVSKNYDSLWHKYEFLKLDEDALEFRLDQVCNEFKSWSLQSQNEFLAEHKEEVRDFQPDDADGDLRSLDVLPVLGHVIPRIESALPSCNVDIESAIHEHQMIIDYLDRYLAKMKKKVNLASISTSKPERSDLKLENFSTVSHQYFKDTLGKYNPKRLKVNNWSNVLRQRVARKLKWKKEKLRLIAESTNYGERMIKQCLILPVPLKNASAQVRSDFIKVSIYHCQYNSFKRDDLKTATFWRAYDTEGKLRSSLEGYFGIRDREAYIYRMIPKVCKWY